MTTTELMNMQTDLEVMEYLAQKMLDTIAVTQAAIEEKLANEALINAQG